MRLLSMSIPSDAHTKTITLTPIEITCTRTNLSFLLSWFSDNRHWWWWNEFVTLFFLRLQGPTNWYHVRRLEPIMILHWRLCRFRHCPDGIVHVPYNSATIIFFAAQQPTLSCYGSAQIALPHDATSIFEFQNHLWMMTS